MPRVQKKIHYIYKTTCDVTKRYYYGMHSTNNLNDGYLGSGQRLWKSINKHGRENHSIEILEYLDDRNSLKAREKELITEDLLHDPMCMNIALGGTGGLLNKEHANKFHKAGGKATGRKNITYVNDNKINTSNRYKNFPDWTGKSHKDETKEKIRKKNSINQKGSKNSQFGTCWITNEIENKKINKCDNIPNGWKLGRKLKF